MLNKRLSVSPARWSARALTVARAALQSPALGVDQSGIYLARWHGHRLYPRRAIPQSLLGGFEQMFICDSRRPAEENCSRG